MKYRFLGKTGLKVSVYALGTNSFGGRADKETSIRIIHHALDHGVNFIDTADIYTDGQSEAIIGEALEGRRHEVVLTTKVGMRIGQGPNDESSSRWHIFRQVEKSLQRLKTDYIDLYQIHRFDPHTPVEETLRALEDLRRQGKILYAGASNFAAWQLMKALGLSERLNLIRYESIQMGYSLIDRRIEDEMVPLALEEKVGILCYYPLGGGILTGKYRKGEAPPPGSRAVTQPRFAQRLTDRSLAIAEKVSELAAQMGVTPSQLSLAWVMAKPGVTSVLVGATRVEQQEENLKAVDLEIPEEVMDQLDRISDPHGPA
ncbi:MAG: aldo/keto reductase [Clostridiales bacterium]|nr:aldo/keto reductase [Clostridiales bacterium]MBT9259926.1 aldo/keto reductase [Clostridiales bacterium]